MVAVVELLPNIGQIIRRVPTQMLINAYVRAARDFCRQTRWLREDRTVVTTINEDDYTLADSATAEVVGIRRIWAVASDDSEWEIRPKDSTLWTNPTDTGQPMHYAYVPEGAFKLHVIPDAAYTLTVTAAMQPLLASTTLSDALATKWDHVLEEGALEYLFGVPGQKWSNPVESLKRGRAFRAGINNAKADEQRGFNQGSMRTRARAFGGFNVGRR
jgi:hypothetical protein